MSKAYFVPCEEAESEFTEKRSRFIGHVRRIESEAEARAFLETIKKKHYDARHNCWCTSFMRAVSCATVTTASLRARRDSRC